MSNETEPEWLQNLRSRARESRSSAVKLFCIDCMGGNRFDAVKCTNSTCALWPWAFRRGKGQADV